MALKIRTVTHAVHRNTITFDSPIGAPNDGGHKWLNETFKLIHLNSQVGALTVQFGPGGSISSMVFEEKEVIPQSKIEFSEEESLTSGSTMNNNHK